MLLRVAVLFASLIVSTPCLAQTPLPPPLPLFDDDLDEPSEDAPPSIELVVEQETPFSNKVFFIYDCSSSMNRRKLNRALAALRMISEQPIDEMQIAIIAFDNNMTRWPGIPEPDAPHPVPDGWAALPSEIAIREVQQWLSTVSHGGMTNVIRPLMAAMREERNNISIVIISDGQFNDSLPSPPLDGEDFPSHYIRHIISIIRNEQNKREDKGLDRIQINAYGIGSTQQVLTRICQETGGAYMRESDD